MNERSKIKNTKLVWRSFVAFVFIFFCLPVVGYAISRLPNGDPFVSLVLLFLAAGFWIAERTRCPHCSERLSRNPAYNTGRLNFAGRTLFLGR